MTIFTWSWLFLVVYVGGMLVIGYIATRRIKNADGYATARGSYGPFFLAMAFAATTASGATFLGGPGLAYQFGTAVIWTMLYPIGVYLGLLICMRLVATAGNRFANRSIPEFLGEIPVPQVLVPSWVIVMVPMAYGYWLRFFHWRCFPILPGNLSLVL